MSAHIKVDCVLHTSNYSIRKNLPALLKEFPLLSFDTEVRSVYDKAERLEAKEYLKDTNPLDPLYKQARVVMESSGLSFPSIVRTTHFIFGTSRSKSHVIVCTTPEIEMFIWNAIAEYEGKLIVHNSLFDLKIMYQRIGKMPKDFVDTALIIKCLINHVNIWKAKVGLKDLMGEYYDPKWVLMDDYEPEDLKLPSFIMYAAIDGAATFHLYELVQEELAGESDDESDESEQDSAEA